MRASDSEKSAIRELCIHKRRLSNIERDNKKEEEMDGAKEGRAGGVGSHRARWGRG